MSQTGREATTNGESKWAAQNPLQGLPEGLVLEVMVNKHDVVKIRGTDVQEMLDSLSGAAQNLFGWVQRHDRKST